MSWRLGASALGNCTLNDCGCLGKSTYYFVGTNHSILLIVGVQENSVLGYCRGPGNPKVGACVPHFT